MSRVSLVAQTVLRLDRRVVVVLVGIGVAASCVGIGSATGALRQRDGWGEQVASAAQWYLRYRPRTGRRDCSGLVEAVLARAGAPIRGSSRTLWQDADRDGRLAGEPRPGDLVFFDRTYDANRNGRVDDVLTHVAVVTNVDAEGTVVMVHRGGGGIRPLRMNLSQPQVHRRGGRVLNDFLAAPGYGCRFSPRLAGQLYRGAARPPRPRGP